MFSFKFIKNFKPRVSDKVSNLWISVTDMCTW